MRRNGRNPFPPDLGSSEGRCHRSSSRKHFRRSLFYGDFLGEKPGNWIAIKHEFDEVSFYARLDKINVEIGDRLETGEEIGTVVSTPGYSGLRFSIHRPVENESDSIYPYNPLQTRSIPYRLQYCTGPDNRLQIKDIRTFFENTEDPANKEPTKLFHMSNYHNPLLDRLSEMYTEDQESCVRWIHAEEAQKNACEQSMMSIRRAHNGELKQIIDRYGWPPYESIGTRGSEALWLLVQHQDEDIEFQKLCLKLLKIQVDQGTASFSNYAYLLDRTRMNEQLPQVYGTQWIGNIGEVTLYQTENIDELDARRSQAGLCSVSEYKDLLKKCYNFRDEDFK